MRMNQRRRRKSTVNPDDLAVFAQPSDSEPGSNASNFAPESSYNQRSGGLLAGADAIMRNLTSASDALILGAFGGYTTANVDFKSAPVSQSFSGGSVGTYATYVNGGFFADAIFKADFLSL